MATLPAFDCDWAVPVPDEDYLSFFVSAAGRARRRMWCSMFIIDPRFDYDPLLSVRTLINALDDSRARNVDVRVLLGDSSTVDQIWLANRTALGLLTRRQITARQTDLSLESTHSKFVIFDDRLALVGSHNWSHEGLGLAREDSLAVQSPDLARMLALEFEERWAMYRGELA
jgi:phosphatidylserine/phosphatidylglycerophosphate/cardiolipin synthase-like enzyme